MTADRAYTSRRAMQQACNIENRARGVAAYDGYPSHDALYVERCQTDTPLYRLCSNNATGGMHIHFTGSSREIRAYLQGASDYRWHQETTTR